VWFFSQFRRISALLKIFNPNSQWVGHIEPTLFEDKSLRKTLSVKIVKNMLTLANRLVNFSSQKLSL
jgi:hypothetical protein